MHAWISALVVSLLPAMVPAVVAPAGAPAKPRPVSREFADAEAFYRQALARHGIIGSSLLVLRDQKVVGRAVHGFADREAKRPVDEETIFHWASITKTFTGIAVLQLRDRGRLTLDDPIVTYLPELRQVHNPYGDMSQVTIRHLLSHSAGFRAGTWPWGTDKDWEPFEPPRYEQVAAMLPYTELLFRPGSKYSYSNPALVFLGRLIEVLTNEDYEVYVDKNVLRPLGMYRSFFDRAPYHLLPHLSHSYFFDASTYRELPFDFDTGATVANGGLNAPLGDMALYLGFLTGSNDPAQQARYDAILKRSTLVEMWQPVVPVVDQTSGDTRVSMGLTFFVEHRAGLDIVAHTGSQSGFFSHFFVHVPSRTAYLVAHNTYALKPNGDTPAPVPNTRQLNLELRDYVLTTLFPALWKAGPRSPGQ